MINEFKIAELISNPINGLTEKSTDLEADAGFSTGLIELDKISGGIAPKNMWVITGRPSVGKTALVSGMVAHACLHEGKKVAVFTADHSAQDFLERLLCAESKVRLRDFKSGALTDSAWPRLIDKAAKIADINLKIFEGTWLSVAEMKKILTGETFDLVVIDKFHSLMLKDEAAEGSSNRINELTQVTIELKGMAKEFSLAVMLVCDINKGQENRTDRRPYLTDLKDFGGALESYADVVVGIYREALYDFSSNDVAELIFLKNRLGFRCMSKVKFEEGSLRFSDLEKEILAPPPPPPPFRAKSL